MLALKLRAPEPVGETRDEYWVGDVERCGEDWIFSVIGPEETVETFVHASQGAAECARTRMFRMLCPVVAVSLGGP